MIYMLETEGGTLITKFVLCLYSLIRKFSYNFSFFICSFNNYRCISNTNSVHKVRHSYLTVIVNTPTGSPVAISLPIPMLFKKISSEQDGSACMDLLYD